MNVCKGVTGRWRVEESKKNLGHFSRVKSGPGSCRMWSRVENPEEDQGQAVLLTVALEINTVQNIYILMVLFYFNDNN